MGVLWVPGVSFLETGTRDTGVGRTVLTGLPDQSELLSLLRSSNETSLNRKALYTHQDGGPEVGIAGEHDFLVIKGPVNSQVTKQQVHKELVNDRRYISLFSPCIVTCFVH